MILHTNIVGKQLLEMGFISFICLRTFGIEGYGFWGCTVHEPLKCD